jgi:hypothetical protein
LEKQRAELEEEIEPRIQELVRNDWEKLRKMM